MPALPSARSVYRAFGRHSAWERVGVGIMDKAGVSQDHRDYDPGTWSLIYVLRGNGAYHHADGSTIPLTAGDCFQRIPGHRHSTTIDPESRWLEAWIDFGPSLFQALMTMQMIQPEPATWHWGLAPERIARFSALMAELDEATGQDLPDLCVRCQALAMEALAAAKRSVDAEDDPIARVCQVLTDEMSTRLDLRRLCARESVDYEWLRKTFRQRLGVSPSQYRIRRRIERACALLQTTDQNISAIADDLGYASAYEFSNQFRQWMKMPPSAYRLVTAGGQAQRAPTVDERAEEAGDLVIVITPRPLNPEPQSVTHLLVEPPG